MKNYKYTVKFFLNGELRKMHQTNDINRIKKIVRQECYTGNSLNRFGFNCKIYVNDTEYDDFILENELL